MTYVDAAIWPFRGMKMCHMLADTLPELHAMADRLNIKREWFQDKKPPHYDLSKMKRALAISYGAKECTREEIVAVMYRLNNPTPVITASKHCEFLAATNIGAFHVEGYFSIRNGLAIVLHAGYGAEAASKLLFVSEYATGICIASGKRSEVLKIVDEYIQSQGGPLALKIKLQKIQETRNTRLLPHEYLLS